jgi:hypothetical protein
LNGGRMKKIALVLIALAALTAGVAACRDPKPDNPPDYGATRRDSQKAQHGLDNESGN